MTQSSVAGSRTPSGCCGTTRAQRGDMRGGWCWRLGSPRTSPWVPTPPEQSSRRTPTPTAFSHLRPVGGAGVPHAPWGLSESPLADQGPNLLDTHNPDDAPSTFQALIAKQTGAIQTVYTDDEIYHQSAPRTTTLGRPTVRTASSGPCVVPELAQRRGQALDTAPRAPSEDEGWDRSPRLRQHCQAVRAGQRQG